MAATEAPQSGNSGGRATSTEFLVLVQGDDIEGARTWVEIGNYDAKNRNDARNQAADDQGEDDVAYVAVKARDWDPKTPKTETKPQRTWS